METKTVMSRCHLYRGRWTPEAFSPLSMQRTIAKALEIDRRHPPGFVTSSGTKYHWNGSTCIHVRGKFAFVQADRILSGYEFIRVAPGEVCKTCEYNFDNA